MGHEATMKAEDVSRKRNNRQKIIVVLVILILNGLAFYGFDNVSKMQSYTEIIRRVGSLQEGGKMQVPSIVEEHSIISVRLNDALEEVRELRRELRKTREQVVEEQEKHMELLTDIHANTKAIFESQSNGDRDSGLAALKESIVKDPYHLWMLDRRNSLPAEFREYVASRKLPKGFNYGLKTDQMTATVGQACVANIDDITKFMSYDIGKVCPDDDSLAQKLLLAGCEPLPRRRCFARSPQDPSEPLQYPDSLWTVPDDGNINWEAYRCKSFECLNTRKAKKVFDDCNDCFDLDGVESRRWVGKLSVPPSISYTVDQVVAMKKGGLRIGLDIGGGTASFAVRMREHNVTIITSTLNLNAPFNNFVAQRGVLPFFMTIGQRFPFFDNTLDIVHSMHVLSNWIPLDTMEFIFYDIDRVLRPGGILWLDHFFCVQSELDTKYAPMIRMLGYKELRWDVSNKMDRGGPERQEVYLSALLEKPLASRS